MQQDPYQPRAPFNPHQSSPMPSEGVQDFRQPHQQVPAAGGQPVYQQNYPVAVQFGSGQAASVLPGAAYGAFFARFLALLIDGLIVGVLLGIIWAVGLLIIVPLSAVMGDTVGAMLGVVATLFAVPLTIALPLLYHMVLETGPRQATFGKRALGLRVVKDDGRTLTKMQSAGRCLVRYLFSGAFFGLGYFLALFTDRKQTLHDLLLGTIVVKG